MSEDKKYEDVVTSEFTVAFESVFEASPNKSGKMMFSLYALFAKDDPYVKVLKKMQGDAIRKMWPDKDRRPKLQNAIRDSLVSNDEGKIPAEPSPDGWGFGDVYFVRFQSVKQPGVVYQKGLKPIINPNDFYGGCKARAQIHTFSYDKGSKGVGFGVTNLMKTGDGDRMGGGGQSAQEAFKDFGTSTGEDSPENYDVSDDDEMFG